MKPIAWCRCCACEVVKSGRRRHHTQQREWLGLFDPEPIQKLRSNAIDIVGIDAIKLEGCTAMQARAQGIHPRDARVQSPARNSGGMSKKKKKKTTSRDREIYPVRLFRDRERTRIYCIAACAPRSRLFVGQFAEQTNHEVTIELREGAGVPPAPVRRCP
jgi:hypothetical protein